ncbi:hypothetical protein V1477_001112 [Vespula maculifrons]|uniref:Transmembrane protein n=1 Tax=Vespula maculifrons TaxID=7453 RepID=A0ABD2D245_VESMC
MVIVIVVVDDDNDDDGDGDGDADVCWIVIYLKIWGKKKKKKGGLTFGHGGPRDSGAGEL